VFTYEFLASLSRYEEAFLSSSRYPTQGHALIWRRAAKSTHTDIYPAFNLPSPSPSHSRARQRKSWFPQLLYHTFLKLENGCEGRGRLSIPSLSLSPRLQISDIISAAVHLSPGTYLASSWPLAPPPLRRRASPLQQAPPMDVELGEMERGDGENFLSPLSLFSSEGEKKRRCDLFETRRRDGSSAGRSLRRSLASTNRSSSPSSVALWGLRRKKRKGGGDGDEGGRDRKQGKSLPPLLERP